MARKALLLASLSAAALAACFQPSLSLREGQVLVDSTGGALTTDAGARIDIPAGAVAAPTAFSLRPSEALLPSAWKSAGPAWLARPEGLQFAAPATVTLPVTAGEGYEVQVATARQGSDDFELLETTRSGAAVSARASHFSVFVPVVVGERDGGAAGPDRDAGTVEPSDAGFQRPDVGSLRWDAGRALACPAPDAGYCILSFDLLDCSFKSACSDLSATRDVVCSGATCTCRVGFDAWTVPWSGACSADDFRNLWTCGCGFPVLRSSPPCPDAGAWPGPGLPLGESCARDEECASGYCFSTFCTQGCDEATPCPCGFGCAKAYGVCASVAW